VSGLFIRHYELFRPAGPGLGTLPARQGSFIMRNWSAFSRAYGRVSILSFLLLFLELFRCLSSYGAGTEPGVGGGGATKLVATRLVRPGNGGDIRLLTLISNAPGGKRACLPPRLAQNLGCKPGAPLRGILAIAAIFVAAIFRQLRSCIFLVLFERLPNRPMNFRQAFPGALLTALLWEAARSLFTHLLPFSIYRQL